MTVGERVKELRKVLGLSMEKFGSKIGYTKSGINGIEHNYVNATEVFLKSVCQEYNVNYFWLTEGKGDMFIAKDDILIGELMKEYNINANQKPLIVAYLESSEETKERLLEFIYSVIKKGSD